MKALLKINWDYYLELPELPAESLLAIMSASKVYKKPYPSKVYTLVTEDVESYTGLNVITLVQEDTLVSPDSPELTMEFLAEENNRLSRLLAQAEAKLAKASESTSKELVVE
jgi:hypothetical protein